nr:ribonuclease H-like domain-containing protein [Tanacetum cinerariifolium]
MKMKYWIMNIDHNLWKIIQNGNNKKNLGRDSKGGIIILPPVSFEEHVAVQRETKARTLLLQSLPKDHMADFHHLDDTREIWLAVKARFGSNEESKKMRKTMLKQAFSEFSVSEEEGLHKGYDRFQKILTQLNQMQAKPDNDDVNIKFLRALLPSWSQVALTLKTRGGLKYLSFDDLYNKLRSLKINVNGGSSYGSRSTTVAPTHSAFIGAASTNTKMVYSDQPSYSSLISFPTLLFLLMAMLSLRINKFQKKAGKKINFNNKDFARFNRRKARCYNCLQLGHFPRECNVKKVDEKARYSAFKISMVKTEEPKAMVSVNSMLNWNEHDVENKTEETEQVYGLMAGFESEFAVPAANANGGLNLAAVEFAMMGNSPKAELKKKEWEVKFVESLASDKSSASETYDFSSCVSSTKTNDSFSTIDVKFLPKSDVKDPSLPSCSFKENVKPPRNLCNKSGTADRISCKNTFVHTKKCFVCGSKFHLIKDCNVHDTVDNFPYVVSKAAFVPAGSRNSSSSIPAGRSIPAASRNRSASIHAGRFIPATSRNRPASIHAARHIPADRINKPAPFPAGSSVPTGWTNPAARLFIRTTNLYFDNVHPHVNKDIDIIDSGCSRSMTGNKEKFDDFVQVKGGTVTFGGGDGKITGRGTIRTSKLDFENVYYVKELQNFNFFSISQICDKKNKVLFTDAECLVLTKEFQLPDESQDYLSSSGKQHKASYKAISAVRTIFEPLQLLHMDLFGPTFIRIIDHKYYSLVVTDDFSRFCWDFFMGTKDETFYILKDFIALLENQLNKKVKAIRCDNGIEFQNAKLIALCGEKGIKRDYSNAKTPQQNRTAERKNRTLIKVARSIEHLGKFKGKANDGFLVGYAAHSKAYRVYNLSSKKVEETLNLRYLEDKPNVQGLGQEWYFDLDWLTNSLGYTRFKTNPPAGTHDTNILAGPMVHDVSAPIEHNLDYAKELARLQRQESKAHSVAAKHGFEFSVKTAAMLPQAKIEIRRNLVPAAGDPAGSIISTGGVFAASVPASSVPAGGVLAGSIVSIGGVPAGSVPDSSVLAGGVLAGSIISAKFGDPAASASVLAVLTTAPAATSPLPPGHSLGSCEHTTRFPSPSDLGNHQPTAGIFSSSSYDDDFYADINNLALNVAVDPVVTKRVNTIHPQSQIIGALQSPVQTRTRLVAQGHRQEESIDYDEVFAPVARIEAICLFLAFALYIGFIVYQMDVKSAFLYEEIKDEVYVTQPKGFEDIHNHKHVYRVVKALYGLHQAPGPETQATFGSKSNTSSIPTYETNDFVSCDNSDKSSASETYDFASCVSSPKTNDSFSTVDVKILPKFDVKLFLKSDVKDPSLTKDLSSCSFKENVKPPRNLYNFPYVVSKAASVPAGSRNSSASISAASIHAGKHIPAVRINKPAPFPTGSSVPTSWTNPAARPFFRPTNLYFDNVYWPSIYNHMSMNEGRWGSDVKSSAGNKEMLDDFVQVKGGTVTFGGGDGGATNSKEA